MASDLTLKEVIANPGRFNAPTFDQFKKNPDKYRESPEDVLACADVGSDILRKEIKEKFFYIGGSLQIKHREVDGKQLKFYKYHGGYKGKSLEKVDKIAADLGWKLLDIDIIPDLEKTTAGKYILHVYYVKRGQVGGTQGKGMPLANSGGVTEDA